MNTSITRTSIYDENYNNYITILNLSRTHHVVESNVALFATSSSIPNSSFSNSSMSTTVVNSTLPSTVVNRIIHEIRNRRWEMVLEDLIQLQLISRDLATYKQWMALPMDARGNTVLHMMCMSHPPLRVVRQVFEYPACLSRPLRQDLALHLTTLSNDHGATILHKVCRFKASGSIVQYILDQCKFSLDETHSASRHVSLTDNADWSPLHLAVRFGASLKVIKLLLSSCPGGSLMSGGVVFDQLSVLFDSSNNQRDDNTASLSEMSHVTPIHLACLQNAPIEVLKVLMDDALVFAGTPPRQSNVASHLIHILWTKYCRTDSMSFQHLKEAVQHSKNISDLPIPLLLVWRKALMILRGMYCGETTEPCDFLQKPESFVMHAISNLAPFAPKSFLILAAKLYAETCLHLTDSSGNTPLHILVSHEVKSNTGSKLNSFAIDLFTKVYPQASKVRNFSKRYPLHLALESGKEYKNGISSLIESHPDSLEYRDPKTGLYPFMQCRSQSLDSSFELLKSCPHLVQSGFNEISYNEVNATKSINSIYSDLLQDTSTSFVSVGTDESFYIAPTLSQVIKKRKLTSKMDMTHFDNSTTKTKARRVSL